jgi:O-antigen ligase
MLTQIESQSAQLALIFALAFYFLYPHRSALMGIILFTLVALYVLFFPFVMPLIHDFIPASINNLSFFQNSYATIRLDVWDFVSRYIVQNPWLGQGLEFTRSFEGFDTAGTHFEGKTVLHPHNAVLQLWIELGVVGALFLLAAIGGIMVALYRQQDLLARKAGLCILMTFLLMNSFSYGLWQGWWIGLMVTAAGLILLVLANRGLYKTKG